MFFIPLKSQPFVKSARKVLSKTQYYSVDTDVGGTKPEHIYKYY